MVLLVLTTEVLGTPLNSVPTYSSTGAGKESENDEGTKALTDFTEFGRD